MSINGNLVMTKRVVCAVFDSAVQAYGQPLFVIANGAAIRSFVDEVNRKAQDNSLHMHAEDYELRCLAVFDDETGVFQPVEPIQVLMRGKDAKTSE